MQQKIQDFKQMTLKEQNEVIENWNEYNINSLKSIRKIDNDK